MHTQERPREKALLQGIKTLSNREIIAILLRSGSKQHSALELADLVLHKKEDLVALLDLELEELIQIHGIKHAKAIELMACFELCRRINLEQVRRTPIVEDNKPLLADWLMQEIGHEVQEHFYVIFLDNRNSMISYKDIFVGTCNKNFANPREIFLAALHAGSSRIICAHNHPSGNVSPSFSDHESAEVLEKSGNMLGVKVIDHLIIGQRKYFSFKEHGLMLAQKEAAKMEELLNPPKKKKRKKVSKQADDIKIKTSETV